MSKFFKIFVLFIFLQFSKSFSQQAGEIDGITIPRTVKFADRELILNGIGTRSKFIFDVYTLALYLTNPSNNSAEIMNSNTTMSMIIYVSSPLVTSKKFSSMVNAGLRKNLNDEQWKIFKPELDLLEELINSEQIVKNDVFNLTYNDVDASLWIIKNGIVKGKIPGFEFKKAFFGIWLSDNPVKDSLKKQLLGYNQ